MKVIDESEKAGLKCNIQRTKIMESGPITYFIANRWGNNGNSERPFFSWASKSVQMVNAAMKLIDTCSLEEKL